MYLLDTNVISAITKLDAAASSWGRSQKSSSLYTAAVCEAEILGGLALMPGGRRQAQLMMATAELFRQYFQARVLPFDRAAAEAYSEVMTLRQNAGRSTRHALDLLIAAIARVHGAIVVTRNTGDFEACGVELVNPWT